MKPACILFVICEVGSDCLYRIILFLQYLKGSRIFIEGGYIVCGRKVNGHCATNHSGT